MKREFLIFLYIAIERVNVVALCKLICYEPRHYQPANINVSATYTTEADDTLWFLPFHPFQMILEI
jgi:hypothetical protein